MTTLKIGTEIEWSCTIRSRSYESDWERKSDASIQGNYSPHEFITKVPSLPEIDTKNPKAGLDTACNQFKSLLSCMSAIDVNASQGIHFHVSGFSKKSVIYSKEFFEFFISEYKKMCKTPLELDRVSTSEHRQTPYGRRQNYAQAVYNDSNRYKAINYLHAYYKLKTFEFRLFASTKSVSDYRRYLTFLVRCIAKFENRTIPVDTFHAVDDEPSSKTVIQLKELCL